mgnify:CR=1 FL=1
MNQLFIWIRPRKHWIWTGSYLALTRHLQAVYGSQRGILVGYMVGKHGVPDKCHKITAGIQVDYLSIPPKALSLPAEEVGKRSSKSEIGKVGRLPDVGLGPIYSLLPENLKVEDRHTHMEILYEQRDTWWLQESQIGCRER